MISKKANHTAALLSFLIVALSANVAYAQAMQFAICYVVHLLWGPLGTGMAILAVSAVSAAATMGKGSWGMALTVCVGISVLFGAAEMANILGVAVTDYNQGNPDTWCPDN